MRFFKAIFFLFILTLNLIANIPSTKTDFNKQTTQYDTLKRLKTVIFTSYSYDALSRVTNEEITDDKNGDYSSSYTYDEVSNRIESTIDGVTTQYDYDDNDRLTQQGGTIYSYDDQGPPPKPNP